MHDKEVDTAPLHEPNTPNKLNQSHAFFVSHKKTIIPSLVILVLIAGYAVTGLLGKSGIFSPGPAPTPTQKPQPIIQEIPGYGVKYILDKGTIQEVLTPGKKFKVLLDSGPLITAVVATDTVSQDQRAPREASPSPQIKNDRFLTWSDLEKLARKNIRVGVTYKNSQNASAEISMDHFDIIK